MSLFVALCCYVTAFAVPAYPGLIPYTQPDGTVIQIRMNGDEFCHWVTNEAGQEMRKDENGFYRVVESSSLQMRRTAGQIRRAAANEARRGPAKAAVASGQKHFLVILVQFSDLSFSAGNDQAAFSNLLNQHGYSTNGGTGSARDFYYDNSQGEFEPIFDVYGPVTLSGTQAYYGGNDDGDSDLRPREAVREACYLLNQNTNIDFSQYDLDKDGMVDLVFMYYAGRGEADGGGEDCIWPHQWDIRGLGSNNYLYCDGKLIGKYACTNEIVTGGALEGKMCGIGTACHEFGHAMGLPDMYDTDYATNGRAGALYKYSTMCSGSYNNNGRTPPYFNIEERILLGWKDASVIKEFTSSRYYTLPSVSNNIAYKIPTDMEGEYFLFECRSQTGWDAYIPQAGLIVYHVDKSTRLVSIFNNGVKHDVTAKSLWDDWGTYNSINENGAHPCFYIVPAGDQSKLYYTSSYQRFAFPGDNNYTSFTGTSWNGVACDVNLSHISYANNQVTLYATTPYGALNYNVIDNPGNGVYQAGSAFALNLLESEAQPVQSVVWYFDDEQVSGSSVTLSAGMHVVEAHLTLTSGETKIVELTLTATAQ